MPRKKHLYDNPNSPDFTLGDLRAFLGYVRAKQEDPKLTMTSYAQGAGGETYKTFLPRVSAVETEVGSFLIGRKVKAVGKGAYEGKQSKTAKKHKELAATDDASNVDAENRNSEITLQGEVWAEFAELVLNLYVMTRIHAEPRPNVSIDNPAAPKSRPEDSSIRTPSARRVGPVTNAETGQRVFLAWLKEQNTAVANAKALAEEAVKPVHSVLAFVSDYTQEEPPPLEWYDPRQLDPYFLENDPDEAELEVPFP